MLLFVWGLAIIWNSDHPKRWLEDHENEWVSNQSESSLQNYTMSDLQVRLYVSGIPDINIVENISVFTTRLLRLFCLIVSS